jgi:ATP-dependent RNA helicase DeaD
LLNNFQDFKLPSAIEKALAAMNFQVPTLIQAKAIPLALVGKDVIGCAQTGTGKTAAYCIPALVRLLDRPGKTALILAPTRELVQQIEQFWRTLTQTSPGMNCASLIGGVPLSPQTRALAKNPCLVIATPGRLIDHLGRRNVDLSQTEILVLDEADRMLDMGFAPQLSRILAHLPKQRQTLFFTATWPSEMDQLAKKHLRDPVRVTIGAISRAAAEITQSLVSTTMQTKNSTLLGELKQREGSILVFARTKSRTDRVAKYLNALGVQTSRIHGGRSQLQRNSALLAFRSGKVRIMVATDIAARGIDVAEIAHVINYDLPQSPEDYIHRIGRTGRAGATGAAVSLITPEDRSQWSEISRLLKRTGSMTPQASL